MDHTISIVPIEVALDRRLTLRHVRALIALFSFRSKNTNVVWPTRKVLAKRCGMPETRISTVTSELAALGWLVKEGKGGFSKASSYVLTVPDLGGNTVTDSVTVTESVTVTNPVTSTVTNSVTSTVTSLVTGNEHTSEHTREHNPPLPPQGGSAQGDSASASRPKAKAAAPWVPPDWLNFGAWAEFEQHRKDIRKPLTNQARTKAANTLRGLTHEQQQECIDRSIQARWTGLFPDKMRQQHESRSGIDRGGKRETRSEAHDRIAKEIEERARRWVTADAITGLD